MAFNWSKIRGDWENDMKNVDIQKKHGVSKASLQGKIKIWKAENEERKKQVLSAKTDVEQDAVNVVWNTLLEKDSKYANYTENQKMFVLYCAFGVAPLEAYKKAGYSTNSKHLSVRASELKRKLGDAILEAKKLVTIKCDVDQDDIVNFMSEVLSSDVTDFLEYGQEERMRATKFGLVPYMANTIKIKPKEEINTKLIKSIRISKDGNYELELYSKEIAIDFFTKYFDMFSRDGKDSAIETAMSKVLATIKVDGSNINVPESEDDDIIEDEELEG